MRFMIANHNHDYSCVLTGRSVHNERIERLWRDVHRSVSSTYANMFRSMEGDGILDPLNNVDLYCLHHIFLPRIDKCLAEFQECWNNHDLSSEGNVTPYQLLFEGLIGNSDNSTAPFHPSTSVDLLERPHGEHVCIPRHSFVPCVSLLQDLHGVNPLESCSDQDRGLIVCKDYSFGRKSSAWCSTVLCDLI